MLLVKLTGMKTFGIGIARAVGSLGSLSPEMPTDAAAQPGVWFEHPAGMRGNAACSQRVHAVGNPDVRRFTAHRFVSMMRARRRARFVGLGVFVVLNGQEG